MTAKRQRDYQRYARRGTATRLLIRLLGRRPQRPMLPSVWDPPLPENNLGWWMAALFCLTGLHIVQCDNYGLCNHRYRCHGRQA